MTEWVRALWPSIRHGDGASKRLDVSGLVTTVECDSDKRPKHNIVMLGAIAMLERGSRVFLFRSLRHGGAVERMRQELPVPEANCVAPRYRDYLVSAASHDVGHPKLVKVYKQ